MITSSSQALFACGMWFVRPVLGNLPSSLPTSTRAMQQLVVSTQAADGEPQEQNTHMYKQES